MTAIAARIYADRILVATDSAVTYEGGNSDGLVTQSNKFHNVRGIWFGGAGDDNDITTFHAHLETRPWPKRMTVASVHKWLESYNNRRKQNDDAEDPDFLLVVGDRLLSVTGLSVEEVNDFAAIGSGQLACLVAMDLGLSPSEAVDAACRRVATCRPPVREYVLPRRRR